MSPKDKQYSTYTDNSHLVRKTRQIVMLYEGIIRNLQHAKAAIETNNIQERYNNLTKACEIINGLQLSLDFNEGGDIAQVLYDYYAGLDSRISSIHFSNDAAMCELCIEHVRMMKETWDTIDQNSDGGTSPSSEDIKKSAENTMAPPQARSNNTNSISLNC